MYMRLGAILLPVLLWAQPPAPQTDSTPGAPPEVDKALRSRVSEFLQYHVDGNFRKAYDLVADDTRDEYFSSAKLRLKNFEITDVKYKDDFTKADVTSTVTMNLTIRLQENTSVVPMITTWKLENGKWVWYHHIETGSALTPMGQSRIDPNLNGPHAPKIPEKIDDAAVAKAAEGIVNQITADKKAVKLLADKPSADKVVIHNGTQGYVHLSLASVPEIAGFTATFDKADVGLNQDATLRLEYKPAGKDPKPQFELRVVAEPFNQIIPVTVTLGEPPPPVN